MNPGFLHLPLLEYACGVRGCGERLELLVLTLGDAEVEVILRGWLLLHDLVDCFLTRLLTGYRAAPSQVTEVSGFPGPRQVVDPAIRRGNGQPPQELSCHSAPVRWWSSVESWAKRG